MFCNKLLEFNLEILYRLIGKVFVFTLVMSVIKFQFDNPIRINVDCHSTMILFIPFNLDYV